MKNVKLFFVSIIFLCFTQNSFSAYISSSESSIAEKPKHGHEISTQDRAAMEEFVKLTPKKYGELRGKKLSFVEKIEFKVLQRKLKRQLDYGDDSTGFNIGGFLLGFFLGLLGLIGAFVFSQDRNFRKWTLYGLLASIIVTVVFAAIILAGGGVY
jgi:hypothetical protein